MMWKILNLYKMLSVCNKRNKHLKYSRNFIVCLACAVHSFDFILLHLSWVENYCLLVIEQVDWRMSVVRSYLIFFYSCVNVSKAYQTSYQDYQTTFEEDLNDYLKINFKKMIKSFYKTINTSSRRPYQLKWSWKYTVA